MNETHDDDCNGCLLDTDRAEILHANGWDHVGQNAWAHWSTPTQTETLDVAHGIAARGRPTCWAQASMRPHVAAGRVAQTPMIIAANMEAEFLEALHREDRRVYMHLAMNNIVVAPFVRTDAGEGCDQ